MSSIKSQCETRSHPFLPDNRPNGVGFAVIRCWLKCPGPNAFPSGIPRCQSDLQIPSSAYRPFQSGQSLFHPDRAETMVERKYASQFEPDQITWRLYKTRERRICLVSPLIVMSEASGLGGSFASLAEAKCDRDATEILRSPPARSG